MASGGKGNAPEAADLWYAPARPGGEKAATAAAVVPRATIKKIKIIRRRRWSASRYFSTLLPLPAKVQRRRPRQCMQLSKATGLRMRLHEARDEPRPSATRRAPGAVYVPCDIGGHVIQDDVAQPGYVKATSDHARRNEHSWCSRWRLHIRVRCASS
jgi:hypothetical protein